MMNLLFENAKKMKNLSIFGKSLDSILRGRQLRFEANDNLLMFLITCLCLISSRI